MTKKQISFNGDTRDYLMMHNKLSCGFNMPKALKGEETHSLPPYAKRRAFVVDKYPACPDNWLRSEGNLKSYFVPVKEGTGMWLDFNNNQTHSHHVAIVVSIQGINPITGLPCEDAQMEQYIEECPKHNLKFGPDRYCKECDFKWPKQNYLCTTGTPCNRFWLDGFKKADGVVRQYILTTEKMRGVASNIIGKDRVYAVGISFFLSKEKKPETKYRGVLRSFSEPQFFSPTNFWGSGDTLMGENINYYTTCDDLGICNTSVESVMQSLSTSSTPSKRTKTKAKSLMDEIVNHRYRKGSVKVQTKKLEVGAGAKINQSVYDDPQDLDFWNDNPESIICINYCDEVDARKIINKGEISIDGHEEGFLQNIPVGNV